MTMLREAELLSAASNLCGAADNLRALGLLLMADEIEAYLAMLEAEILLSTVTDH
jgi:hypothetical protein